MSQGLRDAVHRAVRAEGTVRELQKQLDAVQHALLSTGPLMRFLLLYDDLDQAADPLKGRPVETGTQQHPFDRPMPHISTYEARELQRMMDRALHRMSDLAADFFNDHEHRIRTGVCVGCGGPIDRSGRPPNRRRLARIFLETNLDGAPQPADVMWAACQQAGLARNTVRRAADELRICRYWQDGRQWWQLPKDTT